MSVFEPTLPLAEIDLVFVDVETTGLYPVFGDRIVEVGALKMRGDREVGAFARLVDPRRPISPGARAVNGISDDMVKGEPTFAEIAAEFMNFIAGAILVAHNSPFDLGFLSSELRSAGVPPLRNPIVDTLEIARRYFQFDSNSLGSLAGKFNITVSKAHRALADCRTTFRIFQRLMERVFSDQIPTVGLFLDRVSGWSIAEEQGDVLHLLPPALRGPVKRRERIIIEYLDAQGNCTTRMIQLKEVATMRDYVYLVAYCYARDEERTFRLDRIIQWQKAPDSDP
jgi:DNA polymerase III epsilon subunit family exonuclease